ncbi:MAG: SIMPL domain-containing protein [Cyanobacteria bacterium SID2]|nr:SIMPL domain-containing protein [Cyanobacteria bacterium SID2]MBP0004494.1 SIMPL domain-containing protein [Cyanobacteria bacterium SBC]
MNWFVSPLAALMLATGTVSMVTSAPVAAQEQRSNTLTVTGQGIVSVPATIAQVNLGVEVRGRTAEEVQAEVRARSNAVVQLLRSSNVEQLKTTGVRLHPVYSRQGNVTRITGYSATNTVSFRVTTDRAGAILDAAVESGATRIDGLSFVATDETIEAARQQALREATLDAQRQADVVLAALNLSRRSIVNISVNASMPSPMPFDRGFVAAEAAPSPIEGGEQQIRASVTLEIGY